MHTAVVAALNVLDRAGLARLLPDAEFDVVASCGAEEELVELAATHRPDLILIYGRLGTTRTDEQYHAALEIRERWPSLGLLLVGRCVDLHLGSMLVAGGIVRLGWLLRDRVTDIDELLQAARTIAEGGSVLDPLLVSEFLAHSHGGSGLSRLSPREREVLRLLARGRSNRAIAAELEIRVRAVEKHVASLFDKLGLDESPDDHRRVLAALRYHDTVAELVRGPTITTSARLDESARNRSVRNNEALLFANTHSRGGGPHGGQHALRR